MLRIVVVVLLVALSGRGAQAAPEGAGLVAAADVVPYTKTTPPPAFRCDGTDPLFFEELNEAFESGVGYGETWDETICDDGAAVYAPGANGRWPDLRQPRRARVKKNQESQFLALVMPMVAVAGIGGALALAAALAALMRLRRQVVLQVPCPSCAAGLPISADTIGTQHLFCPMCGDACAVDVTGTGKAAAATARRAQ